MADRSAIQWTDATWNPTVGCSLVSPGCTHCYAMRMAARLERMGQARYAGLTAATKAGPVWTGEVRAAPDATLFEPLTWCRPRRVFVNSMSDLFHPAVPDWLVLRVWSVMGRCPQHTFQILTKRPGRMRAWLARWSDLGAECDSPQMVRGPEATRAAHPSGRGQMFAAMLEAMGAPPPGGAHPTFDWMEGMRWWPAVLPNVWLGTSVEDQPRADERVPELQGCPAAVRFLSCEPLLGAVDLHHVAHAHGRGSVLEPAEVHGGTGQCVDVVLALDWVIAGGESGPGARPANPQWFRDLRDQCQAAGVPFFFKQWGDWVSVSELEGPGERYAFPDGRTVRRVGKAKAGDHLEGRQHHAWPA